MNGCGGRWLRLIGRWPLPLVAVVAFLIPFRCLAQTTVTWSPAVAYDDDQLLKAPVHDPQAECLSLPPGSPNDGTPVRLVVNTPASTAAVQTLRITVSLHRHDQNSVRQLTWNQIMGKTQLPANKQAEKESVVRGEVVAWVTVPTASGGLQAPLIPATDQRGQQLSYWRACIDLDISKAAPNYPTVEFASDDTKNNEELFHVLQDEADGGADFAALDFSNSPWKRTGAARPTYAQIIQAALEAARTTPPAFVLKLPDKGRVSMSGKTLTPESSGKPAPDKVQPIIWNNQSVPPQPAGGSTFISFRFKPPLGGDLDRLNPNYFSFESSTGCQNFQPFKLVPGDYIAICPDDGERLLRIGAGDRISYRGHGQYWDVDPRELKITGTFEGRPYEMPFYDAMNGKKWSVSARSEDQSFFFPSPACDRVFAQKPDVLLTEKDLQPEPSPCATLTLQRIRTFGRWIAAGTVTNCIGVQRISDLLDAQRCIYLKDKKPILQWAGMTLGLGQLEDGQKLDTQLKPAWPYRASANVTAEAFKVKDVRYCVDDKTCCPNPVSPMMREGGIVDLPPLQAAGCFSDQPLPTRLKVHFVAAADPPAGVLGYDDTVPFERSEVTLPQPQEAKVTLQGTTVDDAGTSLFKDANCDRYAEDNQTLYRVNSYELSLRPPLYAQILKNNAVDKPRIPLTDCIPGERSDAAQPITFKSLTVPPNKRRLVVVVSPAREVENVGTLVKDTLRSFIEHLGQQSRNPPPVSVYGIGQYGALNIIFFGEYARNARLIAGARQEINDLTFTGENGYTLFSLGTPSFPPRDTITQIILIGDAPTNKEDIFKSLSQYFADVIPVTLFTSGSCAPFQAAFASARERNPQNPAIPKCETLKSDDAIKKALLAASQAETGAQ